MKNFSVFYDGSKFYFGQMVDEQTLKYERNIYQYIEQEWKEDVIKAGEPALIEVEKAIKENNFRGLTKEEARYIVAVFKSNDKEYLSFYSHKLTQAIIARMKYENSLKQINKLADELEELSEDENE